MRLGWIVGAGVLDRPCVKTPSAFLWLTPQKSTSLEREATEVGGNFGNYSLLITH